MKGRLGKWLAVLLSVSMLAGIAPVYGADISMESDFSSLGSRDGRTAWMSRKGSRSQKSRETVTWKSQKNRKQSNQKMRNSQRGNLTARIRRNWSWTALTMKILQNLPLRMLHLPGRTVRKNISGISVCIPARR